MNKYTINKWANRVVILGEKDEMLTIMHEDLGRIIEVLSRIDDEVSLFSRAEGSHEPR